MIRITFEEAKELGLDKVHIKLTEDGLEYYRNRVPLYVVKHWKNEDEFVETEFDRLADAEQWASHTYKDYDINVYYDKSDRYWKKQYQYMQGVLIGVDEQ